MSDLLTWLPLIISIVIVVLLSLIRWKVSARSGEKTEEIIRQEIRASRDEAMQSARSLREEVTAAQKNTNDTVIQVIGEMNKSQRDSLAAIEQRVMGLSETNETRLGGLRDTLDSKMKALQESNDRKLDQIRQTVDEKLQSTLEKRLGESFQIVSERLEAVQRGLGEMQNLATGVGDLKRVLTNVKARGTWGEVQLGTILEQLLTPDQYEKNVKVRPSSGELVEFAIRLPGTGSEANTNVWLPIDAKFPQEDYQRLVQASEAADTNAVEQSLKALTRAIENAARDISEKYIEPPATTDFAILFLPTEGLYAEALRQPGLLEKLQDTYRVVIAGPTTLSAILNSLRMGFRTLAIEKRSSEVWQVLAAVKTEFGKFGDVLDKVKRQLETASGTIDETGVRTRAMERKLRDVEALPEEESSELLKLE
ncbi:MAG: DNA recombination protein RmuC [Nitrospira sp.]|nr:DNA recombination protein RmuC [Nitrospira sp.]